MHEADRSTLQVDDLGKSRSDGTWLWRRLRFSLSGGDMLVGKSGASHLLELDLVPSAEGRLRGVETASRRMPLVALYRRAEGNGSGCKSDPTS